MAAILKPAVREFRWPAISAFSVTLGRLISAMYAGDAARRPLTRRYATHHYDDCWPACLAFIIAGRDAAGH